MTIKSGEPSATHPRMLEGLDPLGELEDQLRGEVECPRQLILSEGLMEGLELLFKEILKMLPQVT